MKKNKIEKTKVDNSQIKESEVNKNCWKIINLII